MVVNNDNIIENAYQLLISSWDTLFCKLLYLFMISILPNYYQLVYIAAAYQDGGHFRS